MWTWSILTKFTFTSMTTYKDNQHRTYRAVMQNNAHTMSSDLT
ncbi:hypothetical protein BN1182_BG_00030 [Pantoea ananatis]|nr:hypothetical protein BN1182_BG_00030 [Pantoea ananatis]